MKKHLALSTALLIISVLRGFSQTSGTPLPASTLIPHYLISVNYSTTTVLVFPAAVRPVDRGDRDILALKQTGAENVLKLKAARKNFPETNLHVFTADGRLYAFDVIYTDSLASTHNLTSLATATDSIARGSLIRLSDQPVNTEEMSRLIASLRSLEPIHRGPSNRASRMILKLDRVGLAGSLLFFRLQLTNRSNLDYPLDFVRLYIRDKQEAKRTSVQEHEITPVYQDSVATIAGQTSRTYIIAVPAFTLADGKQLLVEAYEKNGGRYLRLHVNNKSLLRAKKL